MDHAVDAVSVKDAPERLAVVHIGHVHGEIGRRLIADDGLDAVLDFCGGVGQVVDDDDLVTEFEQLDDGVGADEPGAAGDEDARVFCVEGLRHERVPFMWG